MTLRLWALRKRAMLSPRDRARKLAQESLVLTIRPNDEANGVGCLVLLGLVALLILIPLLFVQMSANLRALRQQLPGLTSGEGVLETRFGGYIPVIGRPPSRPRITPDPLHREVYLRSVK